MFTVNKEIQLEDLGQGVSRKMLSYDKNMMAVEVHFEKGAVGTPHQHPHEQIGYVVSGSIEYQEEGLETKVLIAGDSYYVAPNKVHGVVALEPTVLLDVFTPMREDFIK
ncbi:MAG: cupin domain-containing protein [Cellulosilyticum sp.]|nr:cupin domain-containing protein [Cellulosilyticum sp.]